MAVNNNTGLAWLRASNSADFDTTTRTRFLMGFQDETQYDGVGDNGIFVVGTDYALSDSITLSDGSTIDVDAVDNIHLAALQDETLYDNVGNNGTGNGGTAYVVSNTITLSDGSVVTVDAVNGSGEVTQFTVTSSGGPVIVLEVKLTQVSTSGIGTGFFLKPRSNNAKGDVAEFTVSSGLTTVSLGVPLTQSGTSGTGTGFTLTPEENNISENSDVSTISLWVQVNSFSATTGVPVDLLKLQHNTGELLFTVSICPVSASEGILYVTATNSFTSKTQLLMRSSGRGRETNIDFTGVDGLSLPSGAVPAAYFDLSTSVDTYRFWYDDGSTVPPAVAGEILVPISFTTLDNDVTITNSTLEAIRNADLDFAQFFKSSATEIRGMTLAYATTPAPVDGAVSTGAVFSSPVNGVVPFDFVAAGWVNVLVSWDSIGETGHLYLNDVVSLETVLVNSNADVVSSLFSTPALTQAPSILERVSIGSGEWEHLTSAELPDSSYDIDIHEVYLTTETSLDFSVMANRRLFITAGGLPEDLGADGSTPTGTSPDLYLPNTAAAYEENEGQNGDWIKNGTFTDVAAPS